MTPSAWREKAGLTLKETAKRLGVSSASCVFRYERGEREAPNSVVLAYERESRDENGAPQVTGADLQRVHQKWERDHKDERRSKAA
jgi:transcriptional regulator with XRE-family HTH domain